MSRKSKKDVSPNVTIAAFCAFSLVFAGGEGNQQTCADPTNCLECLGHTLPDEFPDSDDPSTILGNIDLQNRNISRSHGFRVMERPHRKNMQ